MLNSRHAGPYLVLLWSVLLVIGCAAAPGEVMLPSVDKDKELGRETAKMVEAEMGVTQAPAETKFLNAVGERLVRVNPDQRFEYSFAIVDQFEPNAFALPGGWIYVSRGLLILTNTEDELANVVGHEIVHVTRRHSARQMQQSIVPGLLSIPGWIVGGVISKDLGNLINAPVNLIGGAYLSSNSRKDEFEADQLGQQLAAMSGYDPAALAPILGRMEQFVEIKTGQKRIPSFFDTHPTTPDREERVLRDANNIEWTRQLGVVRNSDEYLRKLDGLLVGENPADGVFQGRKFLHPQLNLAVNFPKGWKTLNSRQAVTAVSPQEDALVVMGIAGQGTDPREAAESFEQGFYEKYGVKPNESKSIKINKLPAHLVSYVNTGKKEPVYLSFLWIAHGELLYQFVGITVERHQEAFRTTAYSFRPITDKEKASITEIRLRVVTARTGEDLGRLSKRTRNVWDAKTTAVVNGIDAGQPLEKGQLVKIAVKQPYKGS
jgi:predicted Zn-dependent protease